MIIDLHVLLFLSPISSLDYFVQLKFGLFGTKNTIVPVLTKHEGEKIELGASETLHVMSMCEENFIRTNFGLSSIKNSVGYIREVEKVRDIQSKFLKGALIGRLRSRYDIGRVMRYDSVRVRNSIGIGIEKSENEDSWDDDGTDRSSTLHGIAKKDMCMYEINEDVMSSQEIRLQDGLDALDVALKAEIASIKQTKAVQMEALNVMSDKEHVLLREHVF
ncbi:hypothetical protein TorRG33x02_310310 [Trema orientale]|uniref:Uncharacterized protein n=1 Tax=Trema orientale TaxID=63057 RepID=A0A2P5BSV2_TREOI|nr:hypothetical protein TorRG33x02_310310 [Trema orientale]